MKKLIASASEPSQRSGLNSSRRTHEQKISQEKGFTIKSGLEDIKSPMDSMSSSQRGA
jgi:hypothetical protein